MTAEEFRAHVIEEERLKNVRNSMGCQVTKLKARDMKIEAAAKQEEVDALNEKIRAAMKITADYLEANKTDFLTAYRAGAPKC